MAAFLRNASAIALPALLLALVGAGCSDDPAPGSAIPADGGDAGGDHFRAVVRRTTLGVPHVKADDVGGLGYGYGYVFAEDNLCVLEEEILTVRGQRAKYFGDVPYDLGNTASRSNVSSDAVYKMLMTKEVIEKSRAALEGDLTSMVHGYAAGVSRYVRELKEGKHAGRHEACRNEPWAREITDEDLLLRYYKLALIASSAAFIDGFAAAQPTGVPAQSFKALSKVTPREIEAGLATISPKFMAQRTHHLGSNMYAFGSEVTGGGGIQYGNPHFPWYGGERLYQVHLTVPGKIDVQGASLYGAPVVLIGFNENFAWSHTVSTAYRFTPYALTLKVGDPLTYVQDGVEKPITPVDLSVEVKGADGNVTARNVRLYRSEYGPMIYLGNPFFEWTAERAFTLRDANAENFRFIRQYASWNMSKSLAEFIDIQAKEVASPWVNTTAADENGDVYYSDLSVVPNVSDAQAADCAVPLLSTALASGAPGLPLLDGSRKACDWKVDPAAAQPGALPTAELPRVTRKDWVVNCNESYWLTNTKAPITGFAKIVGRERYAQSLRSRLCHQQVLDRVGGVDGLPGTSVTADAVKEMALRGRVFSAEKFKTPILTAVCAQPTIQLTVDPLTEVAVTPPVEVATAPACAALTAWQNRNDVDARGSLVWDELWFRVGALVRAGTLTYTVPFDPAMPVETPTGLDAASPHVAQAFAAAVRTVTEAGFALDAPRSQTSWKEGKGGASDRIAIPGGFERTGNFTVAEPSYQTPTPTLRAGVGYGPITVGNSYLQVIAYGAAGLDASTFVSYSLSTDPASPHFDDYTRVYSQKQWLKASFTEAEVAADTKETLTLEQ